MGEGFVADSEGEGGLELLPPGYAPQVRQKPFYTKLDPVNYPQAPSNLTLEQVHVYVRHGKQLISCV
jgi:hypothetical protein